MVFTHKQFYPR